MLRFVLWLRIDTALLQVLWKIWKECIFYYGRGVFNNISYWFKILFNSFMSLLVSWLIVSWIVEKKKDIFSCIYWFLYLLSEFFHIWHHALWNCHWYVHTYLKVIIILELRILLINNVLSDSRNSVFYEVCFPALNSIIILHF